MAHNPVLIEVVHPKLQGAERQPVELSPTPKGVHHEPYHQREVGEKRRQPRGHGQTQLYHDVLDRHVLARLGGAACSAPSEEGEGAERSPVIGEAGCHGGGKGIGVRISSRYHWCVSIPKYYS